MLGDTNTSINVYNPESSIKMLDSILLYQTSLLNMLKAMNENEFCDTVLIQTIYQILSASYEYIRLLIRRFDYLQLNEYHCSLQIDVINKFENYYESVYIFSGKLHSSPYFRKVISELTSIILRELSELKKFIKYHKDENNIKLLWRSDFV